MPALQRRMLRHREVSGRISGIVSNGHPDQTDIKPKGYLMATVISFRHSWFQVLQQGSVSLHLLLYLPHYGYILRQDDVKAR